MDLVKLRYFQTVAKTLHFRRAAALLNVSQPPLSKSIKTLEDELGTQLFLRSKRRVELTPAGEVLLKRCEKIFQELEDAKTEVKRYSRGEKGTIRIGCEDGTTFSVLPSVLQTFKRRYPAISCSVITQPVAQQISGLRAGDLDAGIVPLPIDDPELDLIKVQSCSLVAAFADHFPLASKASLRLKDLRHQPVVALPEDEENLYSCILPYLKKRRIPVKLIPGAFDISTLLPMAASGLGIALIPHSYTECGPRGLVYREIVDSTLELSVGLAWKKGTRNAAVLNLVRVVKGMNLALKSNQTPSDTPVL
jgi:DNA-binding transcriptional LysR family regulator